MRAVHFTAAFFPTTAARGASLRAGGSDTARSASGTGRNAGRGAAPRKPRPATNP